MILCYMYFYFMFPMEKTNLEENFTLKLSTKVLTCKTKLEIRFRQHLIGLSLGFIQFKPRECIIWYLYFCI